MLLSCFSRSYWRLLLVVTALACNVRADTFTYDDAGRLRSVTQATGLIYTVNPDEEDNVLSVTHSATDTTDANGLSNGLADWWENYYFGRRDTDPLATPAGDGISSLLKFAFGQNPLVASSVPPASSSYNTYLDGHTYRYLTFVRSQDAANLLVPEQSSDGIHWVSGSQYFAVMSTQDLGDGIERVVLRNLTPFPAAANLSFRLTAQGVTPALSSSYLVPPTQSVPALPFWAFATLAILLLGLVARYARFSRLPKALLGILGLLLALTHAIWAADLIAGPGWRLAESNQTVSIGSPGGGSAKSTSAIARTSVLATSVSAANLFNGPTAVALTPELQALARGLNFDPLKAFNFVHNKIEYQPYYGSNKGAHVTYLDGAGNDFDQASLLIALLNQSSGVTATSYVYGKYVMPDRSADGNNLANWLGLDPAAIAANPILTGNALVNAGIPTDNGLSYGSYITWPLVRVWVRATIGGVTYDLDPSYKQYRVFSAIDYKTASGYNRAQLLTDAGGTLTADYAQNVSRANLESRWTSYTTNLRNYLQANAPNADLKSILGGRRILEQSLTSLTQGAPLAAFTPSVTTTFATVPAAYTTTLRVQVGTQIDVTFNVDSLQSNRLSLTFASSQGQLWLNDTLVAQETNGSGTTASVTLTAVHAYAGASQTLAAVAYARTGSYDLTYSFYGNPSSTGLIDASNRRLVDYLASGLTDSSRQVLTETLHLLGIKWARQVNLGGALISSMQAVFNPVHHIIGRAGQESGYYVDIPGTIVTMLDASGATQLHNYRAFSTFAFLSSAMEHGVLEQNGANGALSTVKCLTLANDAGQKIFKANSSNYATGANIKSQLTHYASNPFDAEIGAGRTVLLHQDGLISDPSVATSRWRGYGYASVVVGTRASMVISGGYSGGYQATPSLLSGAGTIKLEIGGASLQPEPPPTVSQTLSSEPVDLATGAYTMQNSDLGLGEPDSPRGLDFTRFYNSSRRSQTSTLGSGWRHSCEGVITLSSELDMAFGLTQPSDAAQTIVGVLAVGDFVDTVNNPKEMLIGTLAANWTINRILNNTANVQLGDKRESFVSQPDGSWNSPPGTTTTLTRSAGANPVFTLSPRFGGSVTFDTSNRVSQWKDVDGNTQSYAYNSTSGKLTTVTDAYGRTLTFSYFSSGAGNGLLQNVTDSTGRVVSFSYTAGSTSGANLTQITNPESFNTTLVYDSRNRLTDWKDHSLQPVTHNDYDALDRVYQQKSQNLTNHLWQFQYSPGVTREIDPLGGETVHLFDEKNRDIGTIDALGQLSSKSYDGQDHVVKTIDATGRQTQFFFDGNQNLLKSTDNDGKETNYTYDAGLHLWKVTDPTGRYEENTYDSKNHLQSHWDAGRRQTQYFYRVDGLPDHVVGPGGFTTRFTAYDSYGNLTNITRADGTTTVASYNARGDLLTFRDGRSFVTTYTYDKRRLLKTRQDARGKITTWSYDANGNESQITDRNAQSTVLVTDNLNHPLTVHPPDTGVETSSYDARDWLTSETDGLGHAVSWTYDAAHQTKTVTNALGFVTGSWDYDPAGRVVAQKDGLNLVTTMHYDVAGRLDWTRDPLNQEFDHSYDAAGRPLTFKNRRSKSFGFGYAADGLANTFDYPSTRQSRIVDRDGRGLPQTLQDPSGQQTVITYDELGRAKTKSDGAGVITWTYDNEGNALSVAETAAGQTKTISRAFDELGRVTSCTDAAGSVVTYTYDNEGNLQTITYPGAKTVTYTYDGSNRLKTVTDWAGRQTVYSYDLAGRLSTVLRPNSTRQRVTFDNANRLSGSFEEKLSGGSVTATLWQASYSFDQANRLTSFVPTPAGKTYAPPSATLTYDDDSQLVTYNGQNVAHDLDGNLQAAPVQGSLLGDLSWDARNRLTSAGGVSYTYDAESRRLTSTTSAGTTKYIWSRGASLDRLLAKVNPDNSVTRYIYGTGLLYEETTSATGVVSAPVYYHFDWRGDTVALSDASGSVTARLSYSPYGERTLEPLGDGSLPALTTPFCFNGQLGVMTDANGLLNMQARFYSPIFRRFLSEDPSGFSGGSNLYAFASGDPIDFMDPFGLGRKEVGIGAPGFAASLIPVYGSGRTAINDFQNGRVGWGVVNSALAVSDVFLVKSAVTAVGKLLVEGGAKLLATTAVETAAKEAAPLATDSEVMFSRVGSGPRATTELLQAIESKGRTIVTATEGSEELRYLEAMGAEANVGGTGHLHIILRENPSKAAALEEFLHGTQDKLGIIDRLGVNGAEDHVADFMQRHAKLLRLGE